MKSLQHTKNNKFFTLLKNIEYAPSAEILFVQTTEVQAKQAYGKYGLLRLCICGKMPSANGI